MSVYYDLYASGNPQKKDEQQPLHARVIPSGTLDAKKFIELVSKSNGFSQATIEGCLQAVTDELQHWLKQGWIVEVGELGYFSLSLKCDHPVMEKKEIRSPSIHLNKVNLRINKKFRESLEPLPLERMESPYTVRFGYQLVACTPAFQVFPAQSFCTKFVTAFTADII